MKMELIPEVGISSSQPRSRLNDFFEDLLIDGLNKKFKDKDETKKDEKKKKAIFDDANWIAMLVLLAIPVGFLELQLLTMFKHALSLN